MAERTHIPSSPACGHWETLLTDALDGLLAAQEEVTFTAHMAACPACTALYQEAQRGREWLQYLSPEPEIPAGLVERILAQTGPGHKAAHPVLAGAGGVVLPAMPAWQRPGLMGFVRRWAEPRLMMTAAMAFFSIALTLNLTGIRLSQIRLSDLRPTAVRSFMERRLTMASVPLIRYYDHLRLVYEVQSRMRELRGGDAETQPQNDVQPIGPGESKKNKNDGGSRVQQPQQSGDPAQANGNFDPDYVQTSFNPDYVESSVHNSKTRAFRRLQYPVVKRASERSRIWTA